MGYLPLQESGIRWAKQARSFRCRDDQDPVWHSIQRVMDNHVDIMIGGADWQDYNANLEATVKRIEDPNLEEPHIAHANHSSSVMQSDWVGR